jgi:hypothetical protein
LFREKKFAKKRAISGHIQYMDVIGSQIIEGFIFWGQVLRVG